ncbi:TPA: O-antigen polysaccharide polymerase Wzy [Vibrio vulnificus]|uniref:O-antigen polysaccharide polymerase Wzy n=1 Tax=Vibrio vulnificus TaxID=672 RepID=UPI001B831351|nr:O-antigen polysaccharide polymerase Wzy [Vibrio vulnificus]MCA4016963.1 O-antigen polysaccharide polymerase Wzy [Vibrio vulnificus]HBC3369436.1 O-antigen polysaccharide polymerase Wzy [Vibrio vulnificus]
MKLLLYSIMAILLYFLLFFGFEISSYLAISLFVICHTLIFSLDAVRSSYRKINIYVILMLTISVFLCGRFFAYILLLNDSVFRTTYMVYETVTFEQLRATSLYLIIFISVLSFTWHQISRYNFNSQDACLKSTSRTDVIGLIILLSCLVYYAYDMYKLRGLIGGNFLELYSDQNVAEYNSNIKVYFQLMLFMAFGLLSVSKRKFLVKLSYISLISISVFYLILGVRGLFFMIVILLVYVRYSRDGKGLKPKSIIILTVLVGFLIFLAQYVAATRAGIKFDLTSIKDILGLFLASQGSTFLLFNIAVTSLESVPVDALLSLFIPAYGHVANIFDYVPLQDLSLAHHFSNKVNSDLYSQGMGLGWSVLGDLYYLSIGNYVLFAILSYFLCGFIVGFEAFGKRNIYVRAIFYAIFTKIIMLPRSSLSSLFPSLFWALCILSFFYILIWIVFYARR